MKLLEKNVEEAFQDLYGHRKNFLKGAAIAQEIIPRTDTQGRKLNQSEKTAMGGGGCLGRWSV